MFYFILILFTLVGSALVIITVENLSTLVQLTIFTWQAPSLPIGLLILLAFILGALLLYVVSALSALRDRGEKRMLRRRITELEQQVASVRPMNASSISAQPTAPIVPMPGTPTPPQS